MGVIFCLLTIIFANVFAFSHLIVNFALKC